MVNNILNIYNLKKIYHDKKSELTNLINMVKQKEGAFHPGEIDKYCNLYNELKNEE